jgi:hypothetical protein
MKGIYLFLIISAMIIGITVADDIITANKLSKTVEMNKSVRDNLITRLPTIIVNTYNERGEVTGTIELEKEIKPAIKIWCKDLECVWSAEQSGIIQSYNNIIKRNYCVKKEGIKCIDEKTYTNAEIETKVINLVDIGKTKSPNDYVSEGDITFVEKK